MHSTANQTPLSPILVNGVLSHSVDVFDRGFMYGDGLFETIRVVNGEPLLWRYHLKRLQLGCEKLGLPIDSQLFERLRSGLESVVKEAGRSTEICIVKIVISRGVGGRGYQLPEKVNLTEVVICYPAPEFPQSFGLDGVSLVTCRHRLSENPYLAGIKHLNRLDQVLASRELLSSARVYSGTENLVFEGLMLDQSGYMVEGTKSNILLFEKDTIISPCLNKCGVDGVAKNYIFDCAKSLGLNTRTDKILPSAIFKYSGMAITNSVMGIYPVKELDGVKLPINPVVYHIQQLLNEKLMYEYKV